MSTILVEANWEWTNFYNMVQTGIDVKEDDPYFVLGQTLDNLFDMDPGVYQEQERGKADKNTEDGKTGQTRWEIN